MRVILTGATGYLGSRLVRRLLQEGHEVIAAVRGHSAHRLPEHPSLRAELFDLAKAPHSSALGPAEVLIHAAAIRDSSASPEVLDLINVRGTEVILEAARNARVRRVILISSLAAAGGHPAGDLVLGEDAPGVALDAYAQSKRKAEVKAWEFCQANRMDLVVQRPGTIYGDSEFGFLADWKKTIEAGDFSAFHRSWASRQVVPVHVEDVVAAVIASLTRGAGCYHLTDGKSRTVGALCEEVNTVAEIRGAARLQIPLPSSRTEPLPGPVHFPYESARAALELGYEPAWSLVRGMVDLLDASGLGREHKTAALSKKRLKTLLLNTPSFEVGINRDMGGGMGFVHANTDRFPPLDLLTLGSHLENLGWPVEVIDCAIRKPPDVSYIVNHIVKSGIHAVVATVNLPTLQNDIQVLRQLKHYTSAIVVARTSLTDLQFFESMLREGLVDAVAFGECDFSLPEILLGGHPPGTAWRSDGTVHLEKDERIADLDRLPLPARHLLPHDGYRYTLLRGRGFTTVQTSRGCPYSCGYYCPYPLTQGKVWRALSPERVLREIRSCVDAGLNNILFRDATFTLSRVRTEEICRLIIESGLNITWWCETRINCLDRSLLELMSHAGCRGINFGLESGNDEILASGAKQGVDVQRIREVLGDAADLGIHAHLLVAVGLPDETRKTILDTYDLLGELPARSLGITGITPFPGTELWNDAEREGWLLTKDWSRFGGNDTVMRTSTLSADDIRFAARMLFERFQLTHSLEAGEPSIIGAHRQHVLDWASEA